MTSAFDVLDPRDPRPEAAAALRAWLDLQRALVLRPQDAVQALLHRSDPRSALQDAGVAASPPAALDEAVAVLRRVGAVAVPFGSPAYPARLAPIADTAPLLLVRGDVSSLAGPCVAIVGSRAATVYGRAVARRFAAALASAGVVVVSGLATGIDASAHEAALEAGGRTVAMQACGPDRVYPARHRALAERIAGQGALVTEFPPGTAPRAPYFPLRNRLISGVSLALLVVEARLRSGSLVTAAHAAEQGVDVYAVPGPLGAPTSAGTNRLLRDGAYVALAPEELLEDLERRGAVARVRPPVRPGPGPEPADPDARQPQARAWRAIVAALRDEPLTRDQLGTRLGRSPQDLALDLLELELRGTVAEERDGRLRVVAPLSGRGL